MSIIIKSDELNMLIYKYLQECNLMHTAYTLFNEAALEQPFTQFKFDLKSGQLVSLMEKALIFTQIESHVTMSEYEQCKEPFFLLKPHVCKITEQIKQQKSGLLAELNEKVFATMRRTSSVHNTVQPNGQDEDIIYEQKSANFFDKIPLRINEPADLVLRAGSAESDGDKYLCAYESQTRTITVMTQSDNFVQAAAIVPCRQELGAFEVSGSLLVQVYADNKCEVVNLASKQPFEDLLCFKLPLLEACQSIKVNKKIKQVVAFQSASEYCIINCNTKRLLAEGLGLFEWVGFVDYLVLDAAAKKIHKRSLKPESVNSTQQFECPVACPQKIQVSLSQIYFSVESIAEKVTLVYNFDRPEPLYIFKFDGPSLSNGHAESEDEQPSPETLKQVIWATANQTDNLVLLTDLSIRAFEIELNNFSKIIEVAPYDSGVQELAILRRNDQQMYVVGRGSENLLVYDISLGKIERVQYSSDHEPRSMSQIANSDLVMLRLPEKLCLLQATDVEPLFL